MGFDFNLDVVERSLREFAIESEKAISRLCQVNALELQSYAQEHRPWTDRTGQARQRLKGSVEHTQPETWDIILAHGVDYGQFLEFAHEKKYAIIFLTIQTKSYDVMTSFEGLINSLSSKLG